MGILDDYRRKRQARQAAKEMWPHLRAGVMLEIELLLDPNDVTHLAIVELQKEHPEVELRFFQKRGLVLGIHTRLEGHAISAEAMKMLRLGGQMAKGGEKREAVRPEALLEAQIAWLRSQGEDPRQMEKEAQEARMKREAISIGSSITTGTASTPGLPASEPEPTK